MLEITIAERLMNREYFGNLYGNINRIHNDVVPHSLRPSSELHQCRPAWTKFVVATMKPATAEVHDDETAANEILELALFGCTPANLAAQVAACKGRDVTMPSA